MGGNNGFTWWKHGVVYQIYPRSFYDTNGDGVGDIPGVTAKLDYLSWLGVDAIWLSPVNNSPMYDFGYDISDFRGIDPLFGTHDDFIHLINEAHRRGIKIIMDLVINHTSHLHPWFVESRSSRGNPKRDWYIWHDGINGRPPNNWRAVFGGRSWERDDATGQYYYHSFLKEQPDLNWRNTQLRKAVFADIRYWLDRGVDGFRLDAVSWYVKDDRYRDNPFVIGPTPRPYDLQKHIYDQNRPETHDVLKELRKLLDAYPDRMIVGETYASPPGDPEISASYLGTGEDELHLAFDFSLLFSRYGAGRYRDCLMRWYGAIPGRSWPCLVLNNHDQPRSMSRLCRGRDGMKKARLLAAILLTARGTPFLYYGEELGMRNGDIGRGRIQDPLGKKYWPFYSGRDPERTPMQWSGEANAGFSAAEPWLPITDNYREVNVAAGRDDPGSIINFYRSLITIRKKETALQRGTITMAGADPGVLAYFRESGLDRLLVAMNFSGKNRSIRAGDSNHRVVLFGTDKKAGSEQSGILKLLPYEVLICRV